MPINITTLILLHVLQFLSLLGFLVPGFLQLVLFLIKFFVCLCYVCLLLFYLFIAGYLRIYLSQKAIDACINSIIGGTSCALPINCNNNTLTVLF